MTVLEELKTGKTWEFGELLQNYGDLTYRMALQITGGQEPDARDLVQETFLKVWKQWDLQRPRALKGWIYRIMRNLFNDAMRRKYRRPTLSLDAPLDSPTPLGQTLKGIGRPLDENMEKMELQRAVSQALLMIPPEFRLPVVLCDMADLSYDEIADILSCPVGTVRSRIYRGRVQLRRLLKDHMLGVKL
ncbi:MAG: sigma-70 family RNA polymerase sigma factor [Elusimicrobiota bacterium]